MSKKCPVTGEIVLSQTCAECETRECRRPAGEPGFDPESVVRAVFREYAADRTPGADARIAEIARLLRKEAEKNPSILKEIGGNAAARRYWVIQTVLDSYTGGKTE